MNRFDKEAITWDSSDRRVNMAQAAYVESLKYITIDKTTEAVDFGVGTGLLLTRFQPYVKSIIGLDNSQGMLDVFQQKMNDLGIENAKPMLFDAEKDGFAKMKFDLFISSMSFHHVINVESFLKKIYKSLKPGGQICIADLVLEDGSFHSDNASVHHFGFKPEVFIELMQKAGFKNTKTTIFFEIEKKHGNFPVFLAYGEK